MKSPGRCFIRICTITLGLLLAQAAATRAADKPLLHRRVPVPDACVRSGERPFGGDVRIGDLTGDGRCDFLVYRCAHGASKGAHRGGLKPCFLGAFDLEGRLLWTAGKGGNQPSRPMSVAVHDVDGDGAAEVVCFWHKPSPEIQADWRSLADVVVQIRDGRTGKVVREAAPPAITGRRMKDPQGSNWVHQRLLAANFRGTARPRDFLVKLGDTYVAFDDSLEVLWTYRTEWTEYSRCPAYIPAVGDMDADGRDEVNGGYFVLNAKGEPLWKKQLARHMDSVAIAEWDRGHTRAICSGFGHVISAGGEVVLRLGEELVPHGQEVRVADFHRHYAGPEMVIRCHGHSPDVCVTSSATGAIVAELKLNASPTNVGMESVSWNGPDEKALLFNGGWLWDLETGDGQALPDLPPPGGGSVHRMGFYHAIGADVCGDRREELIVWDPTSTDVYVYTPAPLDESAYAGYQAGPGQYNPRLMD